MNVHIAKSLLSLLPPWRHTSGIVIEVATLFSLYAARATCKNEPRATNIKREVCFTPFLFLLLLLLLLLLLFFTCYAAVAPLVSRKEQQ